MSTDSGHQDSTARLLPLYPHCEPPRAVRGLYLDPEAEHLTGTDQEPLIYANFVSSMDGRIALGVGDDSHVPRALTTRPDWRLFQELQAHADCFITHGAYLRAVAAGRLSDILQVGVRPDAQDLAGWRRQRGLTAQPAVIIASRTLAFELPASLTEHGQSVRVVTTRDAPRERVEQLRASGVAVEVTAGGGDVTGAALADAVRSLGCRRAYLEAGPKVLTAMLREGLLGRLYLTLGHRMLGGDVFHTMLTGNPLGAAGGLTLERLYLLEATAGRDGQFFASFTPNR